MIFLGIYAKKLLYGIFQQQTQKVEIDELIVALEWSFFIFFNKVIYILIIDLSKFNFSLLKFGTKKCCKIKKKIFFDGDITHLKANSLKQYTIWSMCFTLPIYSSY